MKSTRPHFDAAPLVEAVFDCFVVPASDGPDLAELEEIFFATFGAYAKETRQEWRQFSAQLEFQPGKATAVDSRISGVRRWNADGNRGVLVGPGVLALNVKPPYGHFEDHLPHLHELAIRFFETVKPQRVHWLGHRYINQVEISLEEGLDPGDLFALYPRLPKSRALTHPPMVVQVEAARFDGGSVMTTLAVAAKTAQKIIYSLDVYARTDGSPPMDAADVTNWHSTAHSAIMGAFLSSITEVARARFKERNS